MITATIFTVLKIAGLVLLALLALVVAVAALVLLVPVRYRVTGTYQEKLQGEAVVSWLFHLLSCRVSYDRELAVVVRILGFPIRLAGGDSREGPEPALAGGESGDNMLPGGEAGRAEAGDTGGLPEGQKGTNVQGPGESDTGSMGDGASRTEGRDAEKETSGNRKKKRRPREKKEKHRFSFSGFCAKLRKKAADAAGKLQDIRNRVRELLEKKDRLEAFLRDRSNQAAFRMLKDRVLDILKHMFPRTCKGRFRFGFEDPYDTGRILTYAAPFYGLYAGKVELVPVFEEKVLEGELTAGGRVGLGYLAVTGVRVLLDRNFRRLLKQLRRRKQYGG